MKLVFDFSEEIFVDRCIANAQRKSTTIFQDIYDAIAHFLSTSVDAAGLNVTGIKPTYKPEYYDKHLSLREYIAQGFVEYYYPKFEVYSKKEHPLKIDTVSLPGFIQMKSISYGFGTSKSIKVKEHNLKTINKISVELLHLRIGNNTLNNIFERTSGRCSSFLPSQLGVWEWRQTFYNKIDGDVYFCKCFESAINKAETYLRNDEHNHIRRAIKANAFKEALCHLCTRTNSDLLYCSTMYGSAFKVKYGAYIKKVEIDSGLNERDAENVIRQEKGVAKIGEKWINETMLYNYIDILFPAHTVQREATPTWLGKQRLDIYIPELGLAIEYQGEQHFKAIDLFGGEEGLKVTRDRDKGKLTKCKANNVSLIYFTYKDNLSEKLVATRLKAYLADERDITACTAATK